MNKTYTYTIILIIIAVLLLAMFTFLWQTETPTNNSTQSGSNEIDIKITDFSVDNNWGPVVGLVCDCRFNLTLHNDGNVNLTGLELRVKTYVNNTEFRVGNYFDGTFENGTIQDALVAGEVREFQGTLLSTVGVEGDFPPFTDMTSNGISTVAMVVLNGTVLYQREYPRR